MTYLGIIFERKGSMNILWETFGLYFIKVHDMIFEWIETLRPIFMTYL